MDRRTLLRSESVYGDDVETFNPGRFLKPSVSYPDAAFGFGRRLVCFFLTTYILYYKVMHRICPGRHLADSILFIMITHILYTFDITPHEGPTGQELPDVDDFVSGLVS